MKKCHGRVNAKCANETDTSKILKRLGTNLKAFPDLQRRGRKMRLCPFGSELSAKMSAFGCYHYFVLWRSAAEMRGTLKASCLSDRKYSHSLLEASKKWQLEAGKHRENTCPSSAGESFEISRLALNREGGSPEAGYSSRRHIGLQAFRRGFSTAPSSIIALLGLCLANCQRPGSSGLPYLLDLAGHDHEREHCVRSRGLQERRL